MKQGRLNRRDLDEFVECYRPGDRHNRKPTWSESNPESRWRAYSYDQIINRDKASLDIFWLRDKSLEDSSNLPDPDVLAAEIAEDLESALEQIQVILVPRASLNLAPERPELTNVGVYFLLGETEDGQRDQVYVGEAENCPFTRNHVFASPSAAAVTVLARNANGWIEWKYADGRTLDEVKGRVSDGDTKLK